jgi:hypothetical protein
MQEDAKMFTRKLLYTVSAIMILGVLATSSTGAVFNDKRTTYLTFNGPVALPGVTLAAGTYTFEVPYPDSSWTIVRVSSRDGRHVYFTAFTNIVQRPSGMSRNQNIVFGEGPAHAPTPIKAWFPQDEQTGRQFIY